MITHVVLAQKLFAKHFPRKDRKKFFLGTVFPDIRAWGILDRGATHLMGLGLRDVVGEESFAAGLRLHSLLDEIHTNFVLANTSFGQRDFFQGFKSYKLVEDSIVYGETDVWSEVAGYFDGVVDEERAFGVSDSNIARWHRFHQRYFLNGFSLKYIDDFCAEAGSPPEAAASLKKSTQQLMEDWKVKNLVKRFYRDYEKIVAGCRG